MEKIKVEFRQLDIGAQLPEYETANAAGCDIALPLRGDIVLYPHEVKSIPVGFAVKIPAGYEAQIRSRAGMARKGVVVANAPGTIDSDHTAELHLLLLNVTDKPVRLSPGQKVAQMVFSPFVQATFEAHD